MSVIIKYIINNNGYEKDDAMQEFNKYGIIAKT